MAEEGYKVLLHVYDLSQGLARQMSSTLLGKVIEGIWHTGIVVYGFEYYFGGGIQCCRQGLTPYGRPLRVVELGTTYIPKEIFEGYLEEIRPRYTEQTYSLLTNNCNNFCEQVAQFLLGVSIPDYILNLPGEVMNSPMGALIMPMIQQFETILRYGGVPQVPQGVPSNTSPPLVLPVPMSPVSNVPSTPSEQQPQITLQNAAVTTELREAPTAAGADASVSKVSTDSSGEQKVDKLGDARARVQEEITREFAILMAEGHLRASEAAALAARRVMERHGREVKLTPKS